MRSVIAERVKAGDSPHTIDPKRMRLRIIEKAIFNRGEQFIRAYKKVSETEYQNEEESKVGIKKSRIKKTCYQCGKDIVVKDKRHRFCPPVKGSKHSKCAVKHDNEKYRSKIRTKKGESNAKAAQ